MYRYRLLGAVCGLSLLTAGCASTDSDKTRAEGAGTGALIGGAIGLLFGDDKESALIGAVLGAVAGDVYARTVVKKKAEYADVESYMNAVIDSAQQHITLAQQQRQTLLSELSSQKAKQSELYLAKSQGEEKNAVLQQEIQEYTNQIERSDKLIAALAEEITYQQQILQEERKALPVVLVTKSENAIQDLQSEKAKLEQVRAQLAALDKRVLY